MLARSHARPRGEAPGYQETTRPSVVSLVRRSTPQFERSRMSPPRPCQAVLPRYRARGGSASAPSCSVRYRICANASPIFLESAYNTSKHRKFATQRNLRPSRPGDHKTIRRPEDGAPRRFEEIAYPVITSCHPCRRFECYGTLMGTLYHACMVSNPALRSSSALPSHSSPFTPLSLYTALPSHRPVRQVATVPASPHCHATSPVRQASSSARQSRRAFDIRLAGAIVD